ncbi:MAG: PqqD family protein [Bacteroides sp.]
MESGVMQSGTEYVVRQAAGSKWIVKCAQKQDAYMPPIPVNECGAMIWEGIAGNMTSDELADMLAKEYGIKHEEAVRDIDAFIDELKSRGVDL